MSILKKIVVTLLVAMTGLTLSAQTREISGTVLDVGQQPVIGAAVMLSGDSSTGTMTDKNGHFSLGGGIFRHSHFRNPMSWLCNRAGNGSCN